VEREEGEEKSESRQEEVKSMACGWRWPLGRPNLPWRLDGKPPTAMWVRTGGKSLFPALLDYFLWEKLVYRGS
jgi:hypothetical protein